MANVKSAKKRVKVIAAKTLRNKIIKTNLKTAVKKADLSIDNGADNAAVVVKEAIKTIDQACAKGVLHRNTAARKKSRLARKLNAAG